VTVRIGIDIGGTFTDLVALDEESGKVSSIKSLTTPGDLSRGVLNCIDEIGLDLRNTRLVIHGTTVGVNALIERRGARTAVLTTEGFRDVLEIGRANWHRRHDFLYQRPPALVPRSLRLEVPERMAPSGDVLVPLDERAVENAAKLLQEQEIESVAIVFLFSYVNPEHEKRAAAVIRQMFPDMAITTSHQVSQEWREYERTNTTVVNAYIRPTMERYLRGFRQQLESRGFNAELLITESNGGAFSSDAALLKPVHTLESGPAAGVAGCAAIGSELNDAPLISFDMGGTTAKCCIVERGCAHITDEYRVDGQSVRIPVVDIAEISAGGGSIARIDAGGALVLGPQSAGSDPGPACYGLGGAQPTVTDANLVIARIGSSAFLGGRMPLRPDLARSALDGEIATPLGISIEAAALGIIRLADTKMALAVRSVTTERGRDPRDYTLVSYGGCGPLHAVAIARELAIPRVAIPRIPSTFSAWGMLATDLRHDVVRTVLQPLQPTEQPWVGLRFEQMLTELRQILPAGGSLVMKRAVDLRYLGQEHTITVEIDGESPWQSLRSRFDTEHEGIYGYAAPEVDVEVLNLRLTGIVAIERPRSFKLPVSRNAPQPKTARDVYSSLVGKPVHTAVFSRDELCSGHTLIGPAVVEEAATSTYIDCGDRLSVSETGFLIVDLASARAT
jgi:N-methylhydantoinase A